MIFRTCHISSDADRSFLFEWYTSSLEIEKRPDLLIHNPMKNYYYHKALKLTAKQQI